MKRFVQARVNGGSNYDSLKAVGGDSESGGVFWNFLFWGFRSAPSVFYRKSKRWSHRLWLSKLCFAAAEAPISFSRLERSGPAGADLGVGGATRVGGRHRTGPSPWGSGGEHESVGPPSVQQTGSREWVKLSFTPLETAILV